MTIKARIVANKISENPGMPLGKAMLEAGYSPVTARSPQNLTNSKGWAAIIERKLPDKKLLKRHNQLLDKKEFMAVGERGDRRIEPTGEIDPMAVARGLDMAYKLKSKYPATAGDNSVNVAVVNVMNYSEATKDNNVAE